MIELMPSNQSGEAREHGVTDESERTFEVEPLSSLFDEDVYIIAAGKRADLVRLSANPIAVPAETISEITVRETIIGGETVYRRGADRAS